MDMRLLAPLAAVLLMGPGCFNPTLEDGVVSCGSGNSCPPEFSCNAANQLCYRTIPGNEPDAALVDASILDGSIADASIADASAGTDGPPDAAAAPDAHSDAGSLPACSDGIDNDCDGRVDFPADPGCTDALDLGEHGVKACDDGVDNDLDSFTDFHAPGSSCPPSDPQCTGPDDPKED
jgi:hypothetical protein